MRRALWFTTVGLGSLVLGCAAILGIEEAVCDPAVDSQCDPAASADDDAAGDDATDDDAGFTNPCEEYCSAVMEACPQGSDLQQYNSATACLAICEQSFKAGTPDELGVDTLQCRLTLARNALDFGERVDCINAGFSGNGECGDVCEVYCSYMESQCNDHFMNEFGDFASCVEHCTDVPRDPAGFDFSIDSGNTLECRFWHMQATFGAAGPRVHCPHAAGVAICN